MHLSSVFENQKFIKPVEYAWCSIHSMNQNTIWSDISTLLWLFKGTGVNIQKSSIRTNKFIERVLKITGITFATIFLYISSEVAFCGITSFVPMSVVICMSLNLCMSLLLWITIFIERKKFSRLICKLDENRHYFDGMLHGWNSCRFTRLSSLYIVLIPVVTSLLCIFAVHIEDIYFYLHCYLFGTDTRSENYFHMKILLFFLLLVENYMQFFLPNLTTLLIYLLCEYMSKSVHVYVKFCKSGLVVKELSDTKRRKEVKVLQMYKNIKDSFNLLQDLTSIPIFLILSQKFISLFFTLTVILSKKMIVIQIIAASMLSLNGILAISVLIVSGSHVKEAHNSVKTLFLELCSLIESKQIFGLSDFGVLPLTKTFVERDDMTLSAAGMIPLRRSLFLQIGAALVTYGVLIVQFDTRS